MNFFLDEIEKLQKVMFKNYFSKVFEWLWNRKLLIWDRIPDVSYVPLRVAMCMQYIHTGRKKREKKNKKKGMFLLHSYHDIIACVHKYVREGSVKF